ncbi:MAG: transposase family protein [Chloroflexi bacterium]|nr:transposase family protein [Chloroflexota bacterium]
MTRSYERHSELPQPARRVTSAPHERWEMDSRGQERVPDVGIVALVNLIDDLSKVKIRSYPCIVGQKRTTRRPRTEDYQLVLRLAFTEWGLPDRIGVDHDSVFYDNTCKSPFPTRFHLWLLALGVDLAFGRPGQPTDQATVERSHQTWAWQALKGQIFSGWDQLYAYLEQRRHFLNHCLPCRSLGELPRWWLILKLFNLDDCTDRNGKLSCWICRESMPILPRVSGFDKLVRLALFPWENRFMVWG